MELTDIKVGFCYTNSKNRQQALVRKVLSIIDHRVNYQFLTGPLLKSGKKFNSCSLRSFSKWATYEIEELDDYAHLLGFKLQKNYTVLDTSGKPFVKCQEKKAAFYLNKKLMKWVDEDTLQFTNKEIEERIIKHNKGVISEYFMTDKNECCVVCGIKTHMTKHHIVPKKDLKYYSFEVKKNLSNLLSVCHKCHTDYEKKKEGVEFKEYNFDSATNWMNHFIETMKPKFLPNGWHVVNECKRKI